MIVSFVHHGAPRGKGSVRCECRGKFGKPYTDAKTRAYERAVGMSARAVMGGRPPLDGPVWIKITIHMAAPSSASKKRRLAMFEGRERPTKKPDCSNVLKAVEDGISGIVWKDDAQVVGVAVQKFWSDRPRVEVTVGQIGGADG